ncbi:uncharacterized protein LOC128726916 [Anopheles nili]|uniref:uncharacterized protein LOC128726916 n=1 Tax=Anopheles nili TaxID=185578 RepID=UPI00237BBF42|nr:uncharacterized protein LOC128726916 [Anopheles nili]
MSAEDYSQQDVEIVRRDIALKNLQLRQLARVLLVDLEFLHFCDVLEQAELTLLHVSEAKLSRFSTESLTEYILPRLELQIRRLQTSKSRCLYWIASYNESQKHIEPELQRKSFAERLKKALAQLQNTYDKFQKNILSDIWNLGDIYQIYQLERRLSDTYFLLEVVRNNHRNCLYGLWTTNLKHTIELSCARLQYITNEQFVLSLSKFSGFLDTMDSSESVNSLHAKIQRELRTSLNDIQVNEDELSSLRQKLFTSADSLPKQRAIAIEHHEQRGLGLQEQIRSIDLLEENRQEIEGEVARLIEQRETIQRQLEQRRLLIQEGMREIMRLERLIEHIERDISDRQVTFQRDAHRLEQQRLQILNDPSLSPEERARLVAEIEDKQRELRSSHESSLNLLEARCDDLKRQTRTLAQDVQPFSNEMAKKHQDRMAELERMKLLATSPSELALIEEQIRQQQAEFNENVALLGRAHGRTEYYTDEHGRYYINEAGERIYKRDSTASEYRMGPDGEWIKVSSAVSLQQDEHGVFYVNKFGQKIYQQQHFTDPQGEYYLDENGERVYVSRVPASSSSEASHSQPFQRAPPSSSTESSSQSEESPVEESESTLELRNRVANDVAYIQNTLGKALVKGLGVIARTKPDDPIGYLSDYLALFRRNGLETQHRNQLLERLRLEEGFDCSNGSQI